MKSTNAMKIDFKEWPTQKGVHISDALPLVGKSFQDALKTMFNVRDTEEIIGIEIYDNSIRAFFSNKD